MIQQIIGSVVGQVTNLVDELHTSAEEKLKINSDLTKALYGVIPTLLSYEEKRLTEASKNIRAEMQNGSMLSRNWRPLTMLIFVGMIVAYLCGKTHERVTEDMMMKIMDIIHFGLGGYVVARSVEKVFPNIMSAFKRKSE